MTGLNHNLITQRFKLNNKVALITGAHLWLFACGCGQFTAAFLVKLQIFNTDISLPDTSGQLCKNHCLDAVPT